MDLKSYTASDVGLARLSNQDVCAQIPELKTYILADGMGGHRAGEVAASETVLFLCQKIREIYPTTDATPSAWEEALYKAIVEANTHIYEMAGKTESTQGMGTTLCLSILIGKHLVYAHVGDSRIYRLRSCRLSQLTRDHSLKDKLLESGELDESLALSFPYKNVITRAIGTHPTVEPDVASLKVKPGDLYFLCSDGLTDLLPDGQIQDIIEISETIEEATDYLITEAKKQGGNDNITIVMFEIIK